jgi:hypothetical protein
MTLVVVGVGETSNGNSNSNCNCNCNCIEQQQKLNTGILRCAQDDNFKQMRWTVQSMR